MAYTLIPGTRQDHKGRHYQLARYSNGKLIEVPVSIPTLSAKTLALLQPVEVESKGRKDVTYTSIMLYQIKGE